MDTILFNTPSDEIKKIFPQAEEKYTSLAGTLTFGQAVSLKGSNNGEPVTGIMYMHDGTYAVGALSTVIRKCVDRGLGNFIIHPDVFISEGTIDGLRLVFEKQGINIK